MRCLLSILALVLLTGCRAQSTAMTNPFLSPDRVPPPATRTLLPGTAQPYYPGDPVPNTPVIGAPPAGFAPAQQTPQTFAPQPAGITPPGGWNSTPQPIPSGSSSRNVLPSNVQPASANFPVTGQQTVQIQPDQQGLRFADTANAYPSPVAPALQPDPSVLPTPQSGVSPYVSQPANFNAPMPTQQPFVQQVVPTALQREVRIRAVPSDSLSSAGASVSRDGFRPQGSNRVRKPAIAERVAPRKRAPAYETSNRFGFDPGYGWLRGQLQYDAATGEWSLQYVAGQAGTDEFGGIIRIANPQVLGDLQPGNFVQLRGQVQTRAVGSHSSVPIYNVAVVQRQRI